MLRKKTIRNILKKNKLKCYKKIKAPMYDGDQENRVIVNCGKLLQVFKDKKIIMDDESYFQLKCDYLPGNDHYFT